MTTLPNLQLLRRAGAARSRRRATALAAFGLGFPPGNVHGQKAIPEAVIEATAIARVFGGEAVLNDEATEARFTGALSTHRYVHLATHGEHDPIAPAFQAVFLAPATGSDGRLEAREIQRLDLEGLEIVSLSACQTGLGRFDLADNLRGLPASFFLAGAETFIGALWDCSSAASECFFTALYKSLRMGKSRRDAFRAAQMETRRSFPQHCDWGAFYLAGAWT